MKKVSESASKLNHLIKHAIDDLEVTPAEYQKIMDCAHEDGADDGATPHYGNCYLGDGNLPTRA